MYRQIFVLLILIASCEDIKEPIDIQGHRGARGLVPENSLPAFLLATKLGVNTLELDLVVSKDSQLVVSHEPFFSSDFCLDPFGDFIPEDSVINIYHLSYKEIRKFDCGSKGNERFPKQELIPAYKPLLREVIDTVESYLLDNKTKPVKYNIELKTKIETDSIFHPKPSVFSDMVYNFLEERNLTERTTIQSFDFRVLQYFNRKYPDVKLAVLIENNMPWNTNIDSLGFTPEIYSCYYQLLSQENVKEIQKAGMKVIPWTVNEISDMKKLLKWDIDGIISDYPDRVLKVIKGDE